MAAVSSPDVAGPLAPPTGVPGDPAALDDGDLPRAGLLAAGSWVLLVAVAAAAGPRLLPEASSVRAAPVMGHWRVDVSPAVLVPLGMAAAAVAYGPRLAAKVQWRTLVVGAGVATTAWATALAAVEGWSRVAFPMTRRHEYLAVVDRVEDPGDFVRTFLDQYDSYPIHVQGHPPGLPLLLVVMDRLGLTGAGWAAVLALAGAGLATSATLVAVRSVAGGAAVGGADAAVGEQVARRAAPFVALAPAAVWLGTSADAFFAGVVAVGIALLVTVRFPPTGGTTRAHPALSIAGGAVLGGALFLTYGAVPLLLIPAGVWLYRRDVVPLLGASVGAAAVTLAFWAAGFSWFDGLDATRAAYEAGVSQSRPYELFVPLLNPAAFALAVGPAAAGALGVWLVRRRQVPVAVWLLPLLALAAVLLADLSGLSKGEVERIWLPFVPWVLVLTALLPRARVWLAAQVTVGLALQLVLLSPW